MRFRVCLCLLLLAGCARLPQPPPAPVVSADPAFARLADEFLTGYLAWRPQLGTALGLHQYDGRITDFSQPSLAAELARLKQFNQRLAELDTNRLSRPALFDYLILRGAIQREIFSFDALQIYSKNPMTYAGALDVNIYIKRNFAPLADRVRSLTAILQQAPQLTAAARANLAEALPRPFIETAIEEANGIADFLAKDLVAALKDLNNPPLMAEFNAANARAIDQMRRFVTYLQEQKLPKANNDYALGPDNYRKLLECELITLTPEQVLETGMRELRRQQATFAEAAHRIAPAQQPIAVFRAIQKEHPTDARLIPDTASSLDVIRQFVMDHHLVGIPSPVRPRVTETPQYLRATSFASMDTPGPFETNATEAYYYVTPVDPAWTPRQKEEWLTAFDYYDIAVTSIHEAYPGHYVQFLWLKETPTTNIEKIFNSYAFVEGWAHYCEQMMLDQGFGQEAATSVSTPDPVLAAKYRLAQADEALLRVCRLCVSVKMHCQGMTVDQATRFFQDNCYFEEKPAREEAMRGTFDPEYLYYTLGKLEILKLRDDYRRQEGNRFSLEQFHNELLSHGAPPLRLMRQLMLTDPASWDQVL